jgi:uncharacterized protein YraI
MKKFTIALLTLALVMAISIPLFAQDDATPATAEGVGVNIRSGPGTEYSLRGGLSNGSLTITGRNDFDTNRVCTNINVRDLDMWLQVDYNGVEGWVTLCAVNIDVDLDTITVVESSHPIMIESIDYANNPSALRLGAEPETFVFGVTRARLNLRDGAGLDSEIIQELRGAALLYVTGMNDDASWVKVEVGDVSGWVARYLLSLPHDWQDTFTDDES